MKELHSQEEAAHMLRDLKARFDSLPSKKRTELMLALKEIFSEPDTTAAPDAAARRSTRQCFARA